MPSVSARKSVVVGLFVIFSVVIVGVVLTPSATGYEVSIYDAYGPLIKISFIAVLVGGIVLLIDGARSGSRSWLAGLVLVFGIYSVFYALPLVRGYALWGTPLSDSLYHLGVASDIVSTGEIANRLYPATHILFAEVTMLTEVPVSTFQMPISFMFSMLLILGCFVAGRRLFSPQGGRYVLVAATPLIYTRLQITILPWFYAICLLPLFLLALQKTDYARSGAVALIIAAAITIYHPLTSLFIGVVAMIHMLWTIQSQARTNQGIGLTFAVGVIASAWAIGSEQVQQSLVGITTGAAVSGGVATYAAEATNSGYTILHLIVEFLILRWGTALLYMAVGGFTVVWVFYQSSLGSQHEESQMISAQYIVGGMFGVILAAGRVFSRNPVRISQFALLFSIFLIGYGLWASSNPAASKDRNRSLACVVNGALIIIILSVAVLGVGTAYENNHQLTHTTIDGSDWFLNHRNSSIQTKSFRMSRNIQFYTQGYASGIASPIAFSRHLRNYQLPTRLGYANNNTVGKALNTESYLITKRADIKWTESHYKDNKIEQGYNHTNRKQIENDPTANSFYTNGAYTIWLTSRLNLNQSA